jgi:hypothetical protein
LSLDISKFIFCFLFRFLSFRFVHSLFLLIQAFLYLESVCFAFYLSSRLSFLYLHLCVFIIAIVE